MANELEQFKAAKKALINSFDVQYVLNKGHVKLTDFMGDDVAVANAARASFEKEHDELTPGDEKLIAFLAKEDHLSPFRHAILKFNIRAPLMIARQHFKYTVGSACTLDAWNEASRRYVTEGEEFYTPEVNEWRSAPENKKQGSGDNLELDTGAVLSEMLWETQDRQLEQYHKAMELGLCAEQARLFLPAYGLYVSYIWTASLQSVMHFLHQRLAHDAQKEIQDFAQAVHTLTQPLFPVCFEAFKL